MKIDRHGLLSGYRGPETFLLDVGLRQRFTEWIEQIQNLRPDGS